MNYMTNQIFDCVSMDIFIGYLWILAIFIRYPRVRWRYREARLFELHPSKGEAKPTLADRVEEDWKKFDPQLVTVADHSSRTS